MTFYVIVLVLLALVFFIAVFALLYSSYKINDIENSVVNLENWKRTLEKGGDDV